MGLYRGRRGGGGSVPLSSLATWIPVCMRTMPLCVSVEFLCLSAYQSVCLSKSLYMPVCLHVSHSLSLSLSLSQQMWCRPSRPGIPSSIPGNSSL